MKKQVLKKKITEIAKALTTQRSKDALAILSEELKNYTEPRSIAVVGDPNKLVVSDEVAQKTNALALYTDGACRGNPGPGSYAFIVQDNHSKIIEQQAQAEKLTTNNKMELKAIIKGLECLSNQVTPMHEIYVYTDSQYVVNGMKTWIHGWKKRNWKKADNKAPENLELWQRLDEQSQICSVIFNWVKGHSGHPQNEYVDGLANKVLDENGF